MAQTTSCPVCGVLKTSDNTSPSFLKYPSRGCRGCERERSAAREASTPYPRVCKDCKQPFEKWNDFKTTGSHSARCRHCYNTAHMRRLHLRQAATDISYQACPHCGVTFVRRATPTQLIRTHCSTRCQRASKRQHREHVLRTRTRSGETIHLLLLGERDGWRCHLCGRRVTEIRGNENRSPSIDHLVPVSAGGTHTWDNVALAHRICNIRRSDTGLAQLRLAV